MFNWLKKRTKREKYVYLDKDKEWIFCYKKKNIIEHKDCDFYEHNLECDKNKDYWNRTHSDSSIAMWGYVTEPCSVLNECKYCLEQRQIVNKYRLSDKAVEWLDYWDEKGDI